jgi:hypothetical protein
MCEIAATREGPTVARRHRRESAGPGGPQHWSGSWSLRYTGNTWTLNQPLLFSVTSDFERWRRVASKQLHSASPLASHFPSRVVFRCGQYARRPVLTDKSAGHGTMQPTTKNLLIELTDSISKDRGTEAAPHLLKRIYIDDTKPL